MKDIEKLRALTAEIDVMLAKQINPSSEEFTTWRTRVERTLERIYGAQSKEYKDFINRPFCSLVFSSNSDIYADDVEACHDALLTTRAKLKVYLDEFADDLIDVPDDQKNEVMHYYNKVFIVHGHDGELKQQVARLLEKQDIEAIILNEKPNRGRTIIEKIEEYAEGVDAAICLYTSDDEMVDGSKRARQNVVFETGYFCGKIGRENTIIVAESEALNLSDLDGIVYVSKNNWEIDVLKELKDIGYQIDMNTQFG